MSRWMIDDFGNIRPAEPAALSLIVGLPCPDSPDDVAKLETDAILKVGMVIVDDNGTCISLKCRPAVMSAHAMSTLGYWLLERPTRPARIEWYDQDWDIECAPDARTTLSLISYMLELKKRTTVPAVDRIRAQPSVQAARRWSQVKAQVLTLNAGTPDLKDYARVLNSCFHGRWMIAEVDSQSFAVDIVTRGTGYPMLDPFFTAGDLNKSIAALRDDAYRDWVMSGFRQAVKTGRPSFDDVDAIIDWPRFGPLRTRYWRILMPLIEVGGCWRVLSASGNDSGIDLRPQDIQEVS